MKASPADQRLVVEVAELDARIRQADHARRNPPQAARVQDLKARRQDLSQELSTRLGVRDDLRTELSRIYTCLDSMHHEMRLSLVLHRVEGMSLPETAETMGVSLSTVKRRLSAAERVLAASALKEPGP